MKTSPNFSYLTDRKVLGDIKSSQIPSTAIEGIDERRTNNAKSKISFRICDQYYIKSITYDVIKDPSITSKSKAESFDQFFGFMKMLSSHDAESFQKARSAFSVHDIIPSKEDPESDYYKFFNKMWDGQIEIKEFIGPTSHGEAIAHRIFFYMLPTSPIINIILISCKHLKGEVKNTTKK